VKAPGKTRDPGAGGARRSPDPRARNRNTWPSWPPPISSTILGRRPGPEAAFKVNGNENNPVTTVKPKVPSDMFLKKTGKWENGLEIRPVDLKDSSPLRDSFSRQVHQRTVSSFQAYWQRQIFSGRDVPPPEKATDDDVITYVGVHAGAVGYVSPNAKLVKVKVLTVQ
jgi:hypothetical protein